MSSSLDAWFAHAQQEEDPATWHARAMQEGFHVYRYKRNPVTRRLAEILQADTGIGIDTPASKELWAMAGQLLMDYHGDFDLIYSALETCRRTLKWQELSPWIQRKNIGVEASRLLTKRKRGRGLSADFFDVDEAELPEEWG